MAKKEAIERPKSSDQERVKRKDFQEVLHWLSRNRAKLRLKYRRTKFDTALSYLTGFDENGCWSDDGGVESKSIDVDSKGFTYIDNGKSHGGRLSSLSELRFNTILEHASWELGLSEAISVTTQGVGKGCSTFVYSNYEDYPPSLRKKDLCRTMLWCRPVDCQNDTDLVLYGTQSMADELGVDLDYIVVRFEVELSNRLATMRAVRRGKHVDGIAVILEGFKDPERWRRLIKHELQDCRILKISSGKAGYDDVRLDEELGFSIGRSIQVSILASTSKWKWKGERKKLVAVVEPNSGDELEVSRVQGRIKGFADGMRLSKLEDLWENVRRFTIDSKGEFREIVGPNQTDSQPTLEHIRVIFAPTAKLAGEVQTCLRDSSTLAKEGWSPQIFTAGTTPEILRY